MKERIVTGIIAGILFLGALIWGGTVFMVLSCFICGIGLKELYQMTLSKEKKNIILFILGSVYVVMGFYLFFQARNEQGLAFVLLVLFSIWATDSGAYFVGRKWGKHKLAPSISPNKTIEGSIGGIVVAWIVAIFFQFIHPVEQNLLSLFILVTVISVAGQVGDLIESAVKRHVDVKDSGNILPGHGGILDRFDSLLFVFLVLICTPFL